MFLASMESQKETQIDKKEKESFWKDEYGTAISELLFPGNNITFQHCEALLIWRRYEFQQPETTWKDLCKAETENEEWTWIISKIK